MPRLEPLPLEKLGDLRSVVEASKDRMGFVPNSMRILAHRPEILRGFRQLSAAINGPSATIDRSLRSLVAQMASRAAGCGYCMAHTANSAARYGISAEKEEALWDFETSPLFSEAERAALRVARGAALVPNAVTDEEFADLRRHYSDAQVVEIVAIIALYGFYNRFNDTMATQLERSPLEAGKHYLASRGWTPGKHAEGSANDPA
jgi:uncharacterized peroxidase-related enzyme